jgi:exodeoxyribonuclease-3
MRLRVTTWNVNSVRLRLDHLPTLIAAHNPDVLCLQETKVVDELFPRDAFAQAGFAHQQIHGQKSYNGVAILSRVPFEPLKPRDWCAKGDCRHAVARFAGGVELHNFYVPAGGDVPDPEANPKFAHKLDFLAEMTRVFGARKGKRTNRLILVGDLNIAPLETDVWSHKQLLKVVSHTPVEVEALGAVQAAHGWIDAVRAIIPPEETLYSWWSYRARDWAAANRGRRLDHVWVTPALADAVTDARVLREARDWKPASDHAPVTVTLDV